MMEIGTNGPCGMKWLTLLSRGQKSRSHGAEIGHKNPLRQISEELSDDQT